MNIRSLYRLAVLAAAVPLIAHAQVTITNPAQGPVGIEPLGSRPPGHELSGLTTPLAGQPFGSGSTWFSVSDNDRTVYPLDIDLQADGTLGGAIFKPPLGPLVGTGADLEGIVSVGSGSGNLAVVSEATPQITLLNNLGNAADDVVLPLPAAYTTPGNYSTSFGLESLTASPDGSFIATANEQSLTSDAASGRVRIQTYLNGSLDKQVSYALTPPTGFLATAANGVVDLARLPGGDLLVLERLLGVRTFGAGFTPILETRTTISLITPEAFAAADDTVSLAALGTETPVQAMQLYQAFFGGTTSEQNYEGLAIGPLLDANRLSLLLVSDYGPLTATNPFTGQPVSYTPGQTLFPLIVNVPEPGSLALLVVGVPLLLRRRPTD